MAHVLHVSVDAAARNRGVGRVIMRALADRMREAGATEWCLSVKPDNAPAIALYRRVGMEVTFPSWAFSFPWARLDELPHDTHVELRAPEPSEDAPVERALDLSAGRLARQRTLEGRVVRVARRDGAWVGVASFDPSFPGAPLFRAKTVGVAGALIRAMEPHRRPGHDIVRLVVEDDAPLRDVLLAAGGHVALEIAHMTGPIP